MQASDSKGCQKGCQSYVSALSSTHVTALLRRRHPNTWLDKGCALTAQCSTVGGGVPPLDAWMRGLGGGEYLPDGGRGGVIRISPSKILGHFPCAGFWIGRWAGFWDGAVASLRAGGGVLWGIGVTICGFAWWRGCRGLYWVS